MTIKVSWPSWWHLKWLCVVSHVLCCSYCKRAIYGWVTTVYICILFWHGESTHNLCTIMHVCCYQYSIYPPPQMIFAVIVHLEVLNYFEPNIKSTYTKPHWAILITYLVKNKFDPFLQLETGFSLSSGWCEIPSLWQWEG